MALDTRKKRASALNFGRGPTVLPQPDGEIDAGDRATLSKAYSGLFPDPSESETPGPVPQNLAGLSEAAARELIEAQNLTAAVVPLPAYRYPSGTVLFQATEAIILGSLHVVRIYVASGYPASPSPPVRAICDDQTVQMVEG